jgi:hypothetical protein
MSTSKEKREDTAVQFVLSQVRSSPAAASSGRCLSFEGPTGGREGWARSLFWSAGNCGLCMAAASGWLHYVKSGLELNNGGGD